jgi:hypothetical protein
VEGFGTIPSLFNMLNKKPQQLKDVIEGLLQPSVQVSEADMRSDLLKVCFLYFFQMIGVDTED